MIHLRTTWRRTARTAAVLTIGAAGMLATAAAPPPLDDFLRPDQVTVMRMSPNGKFIAAVVANKERRRVLVAIDLADVGRSRVLAAFSDADVRSVHWVNDDRLVFDLTNDDLDASHQRGRGLFAAPRDGSVGPRRLIKSTYDFVTNESGLVDRELDVRYRFEQVVRDGSDDVLISHANVSNSGQYEGSTLLRLDTRTGRARSVTVGAPEHVFDWTADREGVARAARTSWAGVDRLYWHAKADAPWQLVAEGQTFSADKEVPSPLFIGSDSALYLLYRHNGDTASLDRATVDAKLSTPQTLVALAGYDFTGEPVVGSHGEVLGVHYLTDAFATHWFDPGLRALQARIDALLPGTVNRIDCGDCARPGTLLVASWSDRQPRRYRLYDVAADTLTELASSRPWIDPAAMARADMTRFKARDGLSIPVHITRPNGSAKPWPTVVLVHGGPWVRGGSWEWDGEAQLLASRGYLVVEPEFRGSEGFGRKLLVAGFKQWGLAMQDDVADAAAWAAGTGDADPARTCIAGASYGGYATLMGLARNPELFRCGVEWVGVTDIDLMYSTSWSDMSDMWKVYGMPVMIGDRVKDAEQLRATSPIRLASKIRQPLLMAYGGDDNRVPLVHGTAFRDAVAATNPNVEWIVYPGEGHGWRLEANQVDFWGRVERFLDRQLKSPAGDAAAAASGKVSKD